MRIHNKTNRLIFLLMVVFVSQVSLASVKICSVNCLVSHQSMQIQSIDESHNHMNMHTENHHGTDHMMNSEKEDCCDNSCHCEMGIVIAKAFRLNPEISLQKRPQVTGFRFINQIHSDSFISSIYKPPIFNF